MKQAAAKTTTNTTKKADGPIGSLSSLTLAVQLLDVTWRVALPIIGLTVLGMRLDRHFKLRPVLTISGLLVSLVVASWLVYVQVKSAYPDFFRKGGTS